jgi:hypothetical protein
VTIEDTLSAAPVLTTPGTVPVQRPHASADYGDEPVDTQEPAEVAEAD